MMLTLLLNKHAPVLWCQLNYWSLVIDSKQPLPHWLWWYLYIMYLILNQGSHSDWKTWKNGKAFSSQGKVREFWTDWKSQGKVRENYTKYWKILKFEINIIWYFYILFLVIFKWTVYFLLKWIKFSVKQNTKKILENWEKILEKSGKSQGILSVRKSGNPVNSEWFRTTNMEE